MACFDRERAGNQIQAPLQPWSPPNQLTPALLFVSSPCASPAKPLHAELPGDVVFSALSSWMRPQLCFLLPCLIFDCSTCAYLGGCRSPPPARAGGDKERWQDPAARAARALSG